MIKILIKAGANVNSKDMYTGMTPLDHARYNNRNIEIINTLIDVGAR